MTKIHFDRKTLEFVGLDYDVMKKLRMTYQGIDIDKELKLMGIWLCTEKGSGMVGAFTFITNWLSRAHPQRQHDTMNMLTACGGLTEVLKEYMEDLWKDRHHILTLNTMK